MRYYCKTCGTVVEVGEGVKTEDYFEDGLECYFDWSHGSMSRMPDYETVEQWEKRTGKPYSDEGAVWFRILDDPSESFNDWFLILYEDALRYERESEEADYPPIVFIVIADPPVPPPDNWRPQ